MSALLAAVGRLGTDPRSISTKSGTPMAAARLAIDLGDGDAEWIGVVAFGGQAELLLEHRKGDRINIFGRLRRNCFKAGDGEDRCLLEVVADSVMSARSVTSGARNPAGHSGRASAEDRAPDRAGRGETERPSSEAPAKRRAARGGNGPLARARQVIEDLGGVGDLGDDIPF
ncbi:single-stranded DNA-binding protein [Chelatococcus sp. GCM10030263]|uniref:single-stranded DNA-binding protein n=1 Tax=Chelatococcus sp. GCM10030263 TaxID=3273387 RepID=UPI00361C67DB